jgi:elongation factor Ts
MAVTVKEIQELRQKTGAGMMDCKRALEAAAGNYEVAAVILRKQGLAEIKERDHKKASEGIVGHYIHSGGKIGVLVEINCETDFVAKGEEFKQFAKDVAMHIAASNPKWISISDVPNEVLLREKDIIAEALVNKDSSIIANIVEGKMAKVFKELCLMEQPFVKDQNISVSDLLGSLASKIGEKIVIKRFARFVTGE